MVLPPKDVFKRPDSRNNSLQQFGLLVALPIIRYKVRRAIKMVWVGTWLGNFLVSQFDREKGLFCVDETVGRSISSWNPAVQRLLQCCVARENGAFVVMGKLLSFTETLCGRVRLGLNQRALDIAANNRSIQAFHRSPFVYRGCKIN